MRQIKQADNSQHWPKQTVANVEIRKRDLVIRIADWTRNRDEPGFDVEVYIGGVYNFCESKCCTIWEHGTRKAAKAAAVKFARYQIARLL